jgi:N-acetylglucosamine-6-phosphate deacetylase
VALFALLPGSFLAADDPLTTAPVNGLRDRTPTAHALIGARIVVAPGQVIERGTIVIRDGLIEAVGDAVDCPADCRRWDLSGKTIYAGLFDPYSELPASSTPPRGPGYWNSQVTPQLRAEEIYQPDEGLNAKLRGQGIVLRLIVPSQGIIRGTSAVVTTGDQEIGRTIVKRQAALHLEPSLRAGRERGSYPNSPMGAMALVRQALHDADWHRRAWETYRSKSGVPRPEQNVALEVLSEYVGDGMPVVIDAQDELHVLRADRLANEFGLAAIIRGSGEEYRRLEAIKATGRAIILPINFPKAPSVATPEAAAAASLEDLLDWDLAPENPARLEKAGVRFALTAHGLKEPDEFLSAVRAAVERGLSGEGALAALTVVPAELFGLADRCGTIAAGKAAHLVVATGDLFDKETKIVETWVDGRRYEPPTTPKFDLRGRWELAVTLDGGKSRPLEMKLDGEPSKLSGTMREIAEDAKKSAEEPGASADADPRQGDEPDRKSNGKEGETKEKPAAAEAKLIKPELVDFRFSASFKGAPLAWDGMVQMSATILAPPHDKTHAGPLPEGEASQAADDLQMLGAMTLADGRQFALLARRVECHDPGAKKEPAPEGAADEQKRTEKTPDDKLADEHRPQAEKAKPDEKPKVKKEALYPVVYPLGAFGVLEPPKQPKLVFLKNATLWTCGPQGILEEGSMLIAEGKIVQVGKESEPPQEAEVMDLAGAHISPGILDCHSHIATDGGVNESGQAITAEVRIGDFIDANDVNIYRQLAGGVTAANILHGSANPIGGQNQVIKFRWGATPEEMKFAAAPPGIKFALGENVKQSNWGERFTSRYPQSRMGVEQIIRDEFEAARAYRKRQEEWKRSQAGLPPRVDLELEAVAEILEGKRLIHCHSYRQDEILALLRVCESFGVRVATLQHVLEGYKLADVIARHGAGGSSFSDWWAYKFEVYDAIPYNGALLQGAGVVVSFNSDDAELGRRLNLEAAKAIKYGGVAPEEALKFVTLNPAKQLGIDKYVGSLEPGKDADFVVWSGSPLSTYSRCEQTWIDGRKYFDRQADLARREEIKKMRADLVQKILLTQAEMASPGDERSAKRALWPREDIFCGRHGHTVGDHMEGH